MSEDQAWPLPRENPDLAGHEAAEKTLIESAASGRMPHAWLICGPEGIGKATLAYRFARYLLAGAGAEDLFGGAGEGLHLDPEHPVFRRVAAGGHADFLAVELGQDPKTGKPKSEIAVADVRQVADFLHLTPAEGGYRVVVVDSIDAMNRHGANALLKILEEPPANSVLLLVCHAPGRVLATIRSRCRKLLLRPLPESRVAELLARYVPDMDAGDCAALARLAEGSPGRALALAAQGGVQLYAEMVAALAAADQRRLSRFAEKFARGEGFRTVTALYLWWLARAIVGAAVGAPRKPPLDAAEAAAAARVSAVRDLDRLVALWEKTGRLFARAEAVNLDRKQVLMSAFRALASEAPQG